MTMVNQKSDGFRSLTGFHGGLRRGTAAAAFGAVLVLSAGVPASNAASELPASELLGDSEQSGATAGTGLEATVDAAGLQAWAAAALSNERTKGSGHRDRPAGPAPSDPPSEAPSESPSVPLSLAPLVPAPTPDPSVTISSSPTPAVPVPSPSDPVTSDPVPSVPVPSVPVPTSPVPVPVQPGQILPAPSPAPTSSGTAAPSRTSGPSASSEETSPGTRAPSGTASPSGSWSGTSAGTGGSYPASQAPAGSVPAGPAVPGTSGSPAPAAGGSGANTETPAADASPFEAITGLSGGAGLRGRSAAGLAAGVWGSTQLAGPNNMATISSAYLHGPAENAVMGASQNGTIAPQVWWGAGLLALAGAAGVAAVRIRRAL